MSNGETGCYNKPKEERLTHRREKWREMYERTEFDYSKEDNITFLFRIYLVSIRRANDPN